MKKNLAQTSRYLERMQFIDRMIEECFGYEHCDSLLIGKDARRELESLYNRSKSLGYKSIWVEGGDEQAFWNGLSKNISVNGKQSPISMDKLKQAKTFEDYFRAEEELRNSTDPAFGRLAGAHYLFIPEIDKLLLRLDTTEKYPSRFSIRLRHACHSSEGKLNIFGSAADAKSEEYRKTLGFVSFLVDRDYQCAFSEDSFHIFEQNEQISPVCFVRVLQSTEIADYYEELKRLEEIEGEMLEKRIKSVR